MIHASWFLAAALAAFGVVAAERRPTDQTAAGAAAGIRQRRISRRPRRQASHRSLQGSAAVAVGTGPARRQDHAAARRRHGGDGPHADRAARHDRQVVEGIHHQSDRDGHRRRSARVAGHRHGRSVAAPAPCRFTGRRRSSRCSPWQAGFKEFANTKDVRVLRPNGHGVQTLRFNYKDGAEFRGEAVLRPRRRHGDRSVVNVFSLRLRMTVDMTRNTRVAIVLAGSLAAAPCVAAQDQVGTSAPQAGAPPGWTFTPAFGFAGTYDDNISLFGLDTAEEQNNDFISMYRPSVDVVYHGRHTRIGMDYTGSLLNYRTFTALNTWDQRGQDRAPASGDGPAEMVRARRRRRDAVNRSNRARRHPVPPHRRQNRRRPRRAWDYSIGARDHVSSSMNVLVIDFDRRAEPAGFCCGGHVFESLTAWRHKFGPAAVGRHGLFIPPGGGDWRCRTVQLPHDGRCASTSSSPELGHSAVAQGWCTCRAHVDDASEHRTGMAHLARPAPQHLDVPRRLHALLHSVVRLRRNDSEPGSRCEFSHGRSSAAVIGTPIIRRSSAMTGRLHRRRNNCRCGRSARTRSSAGSRSHGCGLRLSTRACSRRACAPAASCIAIAWGSRS